jgi:hypothetical protein
MSHGPSCLSIAMATVAALAGVGCGSDAEPLPTVPLCDGSNELTLRIFHGPGGMDFYGSEVRRESGVPSFAVDGQCQYFVSGGWNNQRQGVDLGWRQGTLDGELLRTLEREAGAEDLASVYACSGGGALDAGDMVVANSRSTLRCNGGNESLLELFERIRLRARELWEQGQALDGDLHITLVEAYGGEPPQWYSWPSELAFDEYWRPAQTPSAQLEPRSQRVPAADAASLRALRERYLRDTRETQPGTLYAGGGLPIADGETLAVMYMRDALPYEDERGRLPLPAE